MSTQEEELLEETVETTEEVAEDVTAEVVDEPAVELSETDKLTAQLAEQSEKYLRLAAEYDNFRRRSQQEKERSYADAKTSAASLFLPVYDNLDRALKVETADEAYKKGVEMTMTGLKESLEKLGISEVPALGETFDPNFHNAVMHVEDDSVGENTVVEVFQSGFQMGDNVIRFAMVKVAN